MRPFFCLGFACADARDYILRTLICLAFACALYLAWFGAVFSQVWLAPI
jgi:hypothetical protein